MHDDDEPELAGYDPADDRPLHSRRRLIMLRVVVILGLVGLVLPGVVTTISVGTSTAQRACDYWGAETAPGATAYAARFEVFGPSGLGWECYTVGNFGGERHVASLGLIPDGRRVPVGERV